MRKQKSIKVTKERLEIFMSHDVDVETRTIWMGSKPVGDIEEPGTDAYMAERIIKALHLLESENRNPITILMNNPGGEEINGMAIYDAIKGCKSKVRIEARGYAMSMGSIIFMAGDERIMEPNAKLMVHYGTPLHVDSDLHAKEQEMWTKECAKFRKQMELLYLEVIRKKIPTYRLIDVKKLLDFGTIFSAREAVAMGLADKVKAHRQPRQVVKK